VWQGKSGQGRAAPFGVRLSEQADDTPETVDTAAEPDIAVVCGRFCCPPPSGMILQ